MIPLILYGCIDEINLVSVKFGNFCRAWAWL